MDAVLDDREDIFWSQRIAVKLNRIQADSEGLTAKYDGASVRLDRLRLVLPHFEEAIRVGIYYAH